MLGAIAGDIAGSPYEFDPVTQKDFPLFGPSCRFTDDTVLTVAVAHAILKGKDYGECIGSFAIRYPNRGYGARFGRWVKAWDRQPYDSYGNGSAMRVSPVGFAFNTEKEVLKQAKKSSECTHNHPEGIKGDQAVAFAIYAARTGASKKDIKNEISGRFGYDLDRTLAKIRRRYKFDETCQGSVPEAIIAFLEADSIEDAIRNAILLRGDADTQACIVGGIAEAYFGALPKNLTDYVFPLLNAEFQGIVKAFCKKYCRRQKTARGPDVVTAVHLKSDHRNLIRCSKD